MCWLLRVAVIAGLSLGLAMGCASEPSRVATKEAATPPRRAATGNGGGADASLNPRKIVAAFLSFADDPSSDAIARLRFAREVRLGLGGVLYQTRTRSQLASPSAWVIHQEHFRSRLGPFSALNLVAGAERVDVSVGEHMHCASPPVPPPDHLRQLTRVSVQPRSAELGTCLGWWTVDFFLNEHTEIEAITLDLWEP